MFEVRNVMKRYSQRADYILKGISFKIEKGDIVGVLGENGAGKTTMIKSMLKLLRIDDGSIYYHDKDISTIQDRCYYKSVASVLEGNRNLYWYLSGYENIMYFSSLKKLKRKEIKEEVDSYLHLFGLYDDKDKCAGEYSRGMQQKLSIIIALLGDPEILFLDEPTLGLDVQTKRNMIDILRKLAHEKKVTIFITSHQLEMIDSLVDKLLVLNGGHILYEGSPYAFKEKYSQNEYTISVRASQTDEYLIRYESIQGDQMISLKLRNLTSDEVFQILTELYDRGYEIISFKKDVSDLESIMLNFLKNEERTV